MNARPKSFDPETPVRRKRALIAGDQEKSLIAPASIVLRISVSGTDRFEADTTTTRPSRSTNLPGITAHAKTPP